MSKIFEQHRTRPNATSDSVIPGPDRRLRREGDGRELRACSASCRSMLMEGLFPQSEPERGPSQTRDRSRVLGSSTRSSVIFGGDPWQRGLRSQ